MDQRNVFNSAAATTARFAALQRNMAAICDVIISEMNYLRELEESGEGGADIDYVLASTHHLIKLQARSTEEIKEVAQSIANIEKV